MRMAECGLGRPMIHLGAITDRHTVSFECTLPGHAVRVWSYLTEPDYLSNWLAEGEVERRPGGCVKLHFDVGEAPVRSNDGAIIRGFVSHYEPHRLLTYSWIDTSRDTARTRSLYFGSVVTVVCFELEERDRHVRLRMTHRRLPTELLSKIGAGWHAHLGMLLARLYREEPEPLPSSFPHLLSRYEQQAVMLRTGVQAG